MPGLTAATRPLGCVDARGRWPTARTSPRPAAVLATGRVWRRRDLERGIGAGGSDAGAAVEAASAVERSRADWLTLYKKRSDQRTHVDLAELRRSPRRSSARLPRQAGGGPELRPVRSITWITGNPVDLLVLATRSMAMTLDGPSGLVDRMMASNFSRPTTS
jgi:hypothetical protein